MRVNKALDSKQTYSYFEKGYNISKITILKCNIEKPAEYGRLINLIFQQSSNNTFVIRKKGQAF